MRRLAAIASSLLFTVPLGAIQQTRPKDADIRKWLTALANAEDATAREKALKAFDPTRVSVMMLQIIASKQGDAEREAARRWLPHRAWWTVVRGTIGDSRKKERELLGPDPKAKPGDFSRAVLPLLEKEDRAVRLIALRLFRSVQCPEPEKLLPFVRGGDEELASTAAGALAWTSYPNTGREVLGLFKRASEKTARRLGSLLGHVATPELTPEILALLENRPELAFSIVLVFRNLGDRRAEDALIGLLSKFEKNELYSLIDGLSLVGGPKTIEALQAYRKELPADDPKREWCLRALIRLRAPGTAAAIVSDAAAGRIKLTYYDDGLARLGDRKVVPGLVEFLKNTKQPINERKAALKVIGLLGSGEHLDLLIRYLKDGRFRDDAAAALAELGDPRAAGPLAETFKTSRFGFRIGGALLRLPPPLPDVEEPLLEVLDDPEGHQFIVEWAVKVAGHSGSEKLRERLLELVTKETPSFRYHDTAAVTLIPLLKKEDTPRLREGREDTDRNVKRASTLALAALGDADSIRDFANGARNGPIAWRTTRERNRLFLLPTEPEGLVRAVAGSFLTNPTWFDGAEFLALHGRREGVDLLRSRIHATSGWEPGRARRALLRLGEKSLAPELLRKYEASFWDAEEEALLAERLDDATRERLRVLAGSRLTLINQAPLRILARAHDPGSEALLLRTIRHGQDNEVSSNMNDGAAMRALIALGSKGIKPRILMWLRSRAPGRRRLAAHCLALMKDRASIHEIAPLLDDLDWRTQGWRSGEKPLVIPKVRDAAASAIESLTGQKFKGTPRERANAAREWYEREGKKSK